ncbi:head-tail connector protein [Altericroceibacterium xinjiangense]|uniref:head-tail connector protein n=1 Tax=Altericroceibacterium xinjiangense TaxID=762261 RepID=UPI000F7D5D9F|nr:hypothetical protein [Altericroceibacterium xinjiangense]
MKRAIITPAELSPAALGELKDWLAITTFEEDAGLTALLRAALELCEGFTGQMPLEATCEELIPSGPGWQRLRTRPIQAILSVEAVTADGSRFSLAPEDFAVALSAEGGALVRILRQGSAGRYAVRFSAGLGSEWTDLPAGLRHGIIRLAAHQYRERENGNSGPLPPAAIVALWRPWRQVRLI